MPVDTQRIAVNAPRDATDALITWVAGVAELTQPAAIYWCDGSETERDRFYAEMIAAGTLIELDQQKRPGCYLARSAASDVARVEDAPTSARRTKRTPGPPTTGPIRPR